MWAKKSYTVISNIIVYVLLLLLLTGTIGFFAVFTNGFKGDFKTFYLEYNGEKIISDKDHFPLSVQTQHRFDIRFPLDFFNKNTDKFGYTDKNLAKRNKRNGFYIYGKRNNAHLFETIRFNKRFRYYPFRNIFHDYDK